jgi:hypothetical protein
VAVTHPPVGSAGSTPARRIGQFEDRRTIGPFVYRHRTAAPHAAKAGSIPARVADTEKRKEDQRQEKAEAPAGLSASGGAARPEITQHSTAIGQVVQLVDTRRSERRALTGLGVRLSPWSLESQQQTKQGGQCPVEPHKLQVPGATPGPATGRWHPPSPLAGEGLEVRGCLPAEYANRKSGGVESAVTLWVRLPPRSIRLTAKVQSPRSKNERLQQTRSLCPSDFGLWTSDFGFFNRGCSSNGKTPGLQPGNRGSIPRRSTLRSADRKGS